MAKCVVLWTSDQETTIVTITDGVEQIQHVGSRDPLTEYHRKVIQAIHDAHEIYILGHAEAKMKLKLELLKSGLPAHRVAGTETVDHMTQPELVAKAREICGSLGSRRNKA